MSTRTQIRIVAGTLKGVRLSVTVTEKMRPTPQMVREALFSILGNAVPGRPFWDVFAGTGVIGLEALSRGAKTATFVERDFRFADDIDALLASHSAHPGPSHAEAERQVIDRCFSEATVAGVLGRLDAEAAQGSDFAAETAKAMRTKPPLSMSIALRQMNGGAVEMVGQERAARAALLPARTEHEVIDDQLAAAVEQVGQRLLATGSVEHIGLVDLDPR